MSLTDTTLQDQETIIAEEVTGSDGSTEDGQESRETDVTTQTQAYLIAPAGLVLISKQTCSTTGFRICAVI